jgi:glutathione S-transferase
VRCRSIWPSFSARRWRCESASATIPHTCVSIFDLWIARSPSVCCLRAQRAHDRVASAQLNFIAHADATLTFPLAVVFRYGVLEPGRCDVAAQDYSKWFVARLKLLNAALEDDRPFIAGDRFSVADICVSYALFFGSAHGTLGSALLSQGKPPLSERFKPQTRAYLERMMSRPGWQAAQRAQDEGHADADAETSGC